MCNILDGFAFTQKDLTPPNWRHNIERFLRLHKAAWGEGNMKPKHHYILHHPTHQATHSKLYTCFTLERKHKAFKKYGTSTTLQRGFEKAVSVDILTSQARALADSLDVGTYLCNPREDKGVLCSDHGILSVQVAKSASHRMVRSSTGDVVWFEACRQLVVGKVRLHIFCVPTPMHSTGFWCLLEVHQFIEGDRWRAGNMEWVQLERIEAVATWAPSGADIRVLMPPHRVYKR